MVDKHANHLKDSRDARVAGTHRVAGLRLRAGTRTETAEREREENSRRVSCACATWNLHGKNRRESHAHF